jgi:predicted metal-dependent enzyme (double-stranded beta helix superfamily)
MFDQDRFIADCREALDGEHGARNVREVIARAVSDPADLMRGLGEPKEGGIHVLHRSPALTILNVLWSPRMVIMPHNHQLWAVIGVYAGREDNIFWRRLPDDADGKIEAAGARSLSEGSAHTFGPELIHSVVNPVSRVTGAIHVYGGDFFEVSRSEWDPDSLNEKPYDVQKVVDLFAG